MENDKYNLERFIKAQNEIYCDVIKQLKNGYKETHWIWYIFPQLKGLGRSEYSNIYGIENIEEAVEYVKNKILWYRYLECCNILLNLKDFTIYEILGFIDSIKFCSSLTLFYEVTKLPILKNLLFKYFGGNRCEITLNKIRDFKNKNLW